jgi:hypothetical protein
VAHVRFDALDEFDLRCSDTDRCKLLTTDGANRCPASEFVGIDPVQALLFGG